MHILFFFSADTPKTGFGSIDRHMHLVHALPYPVFSLHIINDHIKSNIIITMERELKCSQNKIKVKFESVRRNR